MTAHVPSSRPAPLAEQPLPRAFFAGGAAAVARALIGHIIVHDGNQDGLQGSTRTAGIIVETEAYDQSDPASHSSRGPTRRNGVMFGAGGFAYVYRSYGIHWCINVSVGPEGFGAAVLLRAVRPIAGLELMAQRRGLTDPRRLASGPGCLTQALGITHADNGHDFARAPLRLLRGDPEADPTPIIATPRIGISKAQDVPWRFIRAGSPYVSGRR